jgi:hypothetical protein
VAERTRTKTAQGGKVDHSKENYSSSATEQNLLHALVSPIVQVFSLMSFNCSTAAVAATSQEQGLSTARKQPSRITTGAHQSYSPKSSAFTAYLTTSASDWPRSSRESQDGPLLQGNGCRGGEVPDRQDMDPQGLRQSHTTAVRKRKCIPWVSAAET